MTCPPEFRCPDGGAEVGALFVIAMIAIFGIAGLVYLAIWIRDR